MAEAGQKRQVAYKVGLREILEGEYVKESGWMPNYILIRGEKVSRVNVVGVVVSKSEEGPGSFLLEDRTGRIKIRSFEEMPGFSEICVGDIVKVIGRPREFNEDKYVMPEIIRRVGKGWFELRVVELSRNELKGIPKNEKEEKEKVVKEIIKSNVDPEEAIKCIRLLDKGDGADYEEVLKKVKDEKIIKILLEDGEIFEIRPGKIKIL